MKNQLLIAVFAFTVWACGQETPKASPEVIHNPASADTTLQTEAADTNQGARIEFEKTVHEFGNITEGEKAEYAFKFKNTGNAQLLIANATASCGCTVPSYSKEPIPPQGEGYIKVVFDSKYRAEAFEKQVTVTSNTQPTETTLYIRGYVVQKAGSPSNFNAH
jgi:hypothetical protein